MAHTLEQIQSLLDSYNLLELQRTYVRSAIDNPGDPIPIMPGGETLSTLLPVFDHEWVAGHLESLILAIDSRRQAIRTELEA